MTCQQIADKLQPYLDEMAHQPVEGLGRVHKKAEGDPVEDDRFYRPAAWGSSRVMIRYVEYLPAHSLTLDEAGAYLARLEAGKRGKHWEVLR